MMKQKGRIFSRQKFYTAKTACTEHVWQVPILKRSVIITMFLTCSSDRTGVAHPTPTVDQGQHFIHNDSHVLPDEKNFAHEFIPKAKDKRRKRLFGLRKQMRLGLMWLRAQENEGKETKQDGGSWHVFV